MLPATGYYKNINCPFYNSSICERPYCHYKHVKQNTLQDAKVISQLVSTVVHKVLHFTSNTKILNYTTDTSVEKKITYNPTPIATLNKYKKNYLPSEYLENGVTQSSTIPPVNTLEIQYPFEFDVRNYVNPSVGYNPTPKPKPVQYIPSTIDSLKKYSSQSDEAVIINASTDLNLPANYDSINTDLIHNANVTNYKEDISDTFSSYSKSELSQSSITSIDSGRSTKSSPENTVKSSAKIHCIKCGQSKSSSDENHNRSSSHEKHRSDESTSKSSGDTYSSSRRKSNETKHNSVIGKSNSYNNSHSAKDRSESKYKSSKEETKLAPKASCNILSCNGNTSEAPKTSSKSDKRSSKGSTNSVQNTKKIDNYGKKNYESKNKNHNSKQNIKNKAFNQNPKYTLSSSNNSCDGQENRKSRHHENSTPTSKETLNYSSETEYDYDTSSFYLTDDDNDDDDFSNGEINNNTLKQCKRIFDEYEATLLQQKATNTPPPKDTVSKKRMAHTDNSNTVVAKTSKPNPVKNAALVMADRYKTIVAKLKDKQKHNKCRKAVCLSQEEVNFQLPVQTKLITQTETLVQPAMAQDEIPVQKIRIAPVQNVQSLLNRESRIAESRKKFTANKTPIMTLAKGSERVAHAPDYNLANIPIVLQSEKSRLPVNVRSRYYSLIVRECMKIYKYQELASQRALYEELGCYLKCAVLPTYRNCCMLVINRLRKESEGNPLIKPPTTDSTEYQGLKLYRNLHKWILHEQELLENGYPRPGAPKGYAIFKMIKPIERLPTGRKLCVRCKKRYLVNDIGFAMYQEDCIYHPGSRYVYRGEGKYSCCGETSAATGCCIYSTHVFDTLDAASLTGFVSTLEPDDPNSQKALTVYALDCEMVYTTRGVELARVTIVDPDNKLVYDNMVRPYGHILDCNTRYSGLTPEMLENISITITEVQAGLLMLFNSKTILIGHSVESDLKALRLIHSTVIDTSVLFPHKMGPPRKRSLKGLASEYLQKIIQNNEAGHDSVEDATTALELVIWKLKQDLKVH